MLPSGVGRDDKASIANKDQKTAAEALPAHSPDPVLNKTAQPIYSGNLISFSCVILLVLRSRSVRFRFRTWQCRQFFRPREKVVVSP